MTFHLFRHICRSAYAGFVLSLAVNQQPGGRLPLRVVSWLRQCIAFGIVPCVGNRAPPTWSSDGGRRWQIWITWLLFSGTNHTVQWSLSSVAPPPAPRCFLLSLADNPSAPWGSWSSGPLRNTDVGCCFGRKLTELDICRFRSFSGKYSWWATSLVSFSTTWW